MIVHPLKSRFLQAIFKLQLLQYISFENALISSALHKYHKLQILILQIFAPYSLFQVIYFSLLMPFSVFVLTINAFFILSIFLSNIFISIIKIHNTSLGFMLYFLKLFQIQFHQVDYLCFHLFGEIIILRKINSGIYCPSDTKNTNRVKKKMKDLFSSMRFVKKIIKFKKMGILESCESGGDTRVNMSLDQTMLRDSPHMSSFNSADFFFQHAKVALFGDIFYKKIGDKTEFILQTHFTNRTSDVMSHILKIYTDSASFMHERGSKIKLSQPITDPNNLEQHFYLSKLNSKPQEIFMKITPFNRYEEEKFKRALYQVAMLHKTLHEENNRYGFVYQDAFVVESGIDKDSNDKCLVLIGDYMSATLNQLLLYRKMTQISWTEKQFEALAYQLVKGVNELHRQKIAHRDIRPHNVVYSGIKKGYVLTGLHNSIDLSKGSNNLGFNLSGVPYYMPRFLAEVGKKQDYSQYYNYDPFQYDVYCLGITLLNALFLDQFMPTQVLKSSIKKHNQKYRFLNIIFQMISQHPPPIKQILQQLATPESPPQIEQRSNIESLRYKLKPQDEQFVQNKKLIAQGYYEMFMYDQWVEEINEVVNYYQLNRDQMQLADIYKQIAEIYSQHHQDEMMVDYFSRASKIYLLVSSDCMEEKKNQEAIQYLEKGIDCNRKGYRGQANTDLAFLLNKLAMVHHIKEQYQIARAFQEESLDIIAKQQINGEQSSQYAEMLISSAKIQMEFQEFKQAETMLKAGIKIIDRKQENKQNQSIKARLLESLGVNYRMKAIQRKDKCEVYRKKAEDCLLDALDITQKIEGSIHFQVGSILQNLGNVYFDRRQFDKAKKSYEKSLIVKQHTSHGKQTIQIGECLVSLANSEKMLKQYERSIKHYDQAIEVFRKAYGNDHNENTAVAIGNVGLVYKQLNRRHEQRQYLNLAKSILKDLYGDSNPDYQYFDKQLSN